MNPGAASANTSRVLIVDDDAGMRDAIRHAFPVGDGIPPVETAAGGSEATEVLAARDVSLVVTDLKMPGMDGLGLLAHVRERYPDIPVLIMTAYATPDLRELAAAGGAVRFLEKPFGVADLHREIEGILLRQAEGGSLHGVSCGVFLQLVRMEKKTCTVRVTDRTNGSKGVLYFSGGELVDARLRDTRGEPAALQILGWPEVSLAIENCCPCAEPRITTGLQALLLEALRLRDERGAAGPAGESPPPPGNGAPAPQPTPQQPPVSPSLEALRKRIEEALPGRGGLWDVERDPSWDPLVRAVDRLGEVLKLGRVLGARVDLGKPEVVVVTARDPSSTVRVQRSCPADRVLEAVSR